MKRLQQGLGYGLIKQWEMTEIRTNRGHGVFTCLTLISEWLKPKWKKSPVKSTSSFLWLIQRVLLPDSQKGFETRPDVVIMTEM